MVKVKAALITLKAMSHRQEARPQPRPMSYSSPIQIHGQTLPWSSDCLLLLIVLPPALKIPHTQQEEISTGLEKLEKRHRCSL